MCTERWFWENRSKEEIELVSLCHVGEPKLWLAKGGIAEPLLVESVQWKQERKRERERSNEGSFAEQELVSFI